ncbi:MAG: hypothetical protein V1726_03560 [Methanobacteriota archaeon]
MCRVRYGNHFAVSNILGYVLAFSIASMIMMSTMLVTTSLISDKTNDAAGLEAQNLANAVADAVVDVITVVQSMPDANYSRSVELPLDLVGLNYYVEVTNTTVFVNSTDGVVSKSCSNYDGTDLDITIAGRVSGDEGGLTLSYDWQPTALYSLDFGGGNILVHSPVESGYYLVTNGSSLDGSLRNPPWWNASYKYRVPIKVNNTVPPEERDKYYSSDLINTTVKIILTSKDIDYSRCYIAAGRPGSYYITDLVFYDPYEPKKLPYCIDSHIEGEKTTFFVRMNISKNQCKNIYLYYGGLQTRHYAQNVSMFFDTFGDEFCSWNKTADYNFTDNVPFGVAADNYNVYVVGSGDNLISEKSGKDWWIKKFDIYGFEYDKFAGWNKTFDAGFGNDEALAVAVHFSGIYVVGYTTNEFKKSDFLIIKYDQYGQELWRRQPPSSKDLDSVANSVAVDPDGNCYVVGYIKSPFTGNKDWLIMKFSSNGVEDIAWHHIYDGNGGDDVAYSIAIDLKTYVYVVGYGTNLVGATTKMDWWIKKFNKEGTQINAGWNKKINGGYGNDVAYSVTTDRLNNTYVVGYGYGVNGSGLTGNDWWIKQYWENGTQQWDKTINYQGTSNDTAYSVKAFGTVAPFWIYVTGSRNASDGTNNLNWWIKMFNSTTKHECPRFGASGYGWVGWNKNYNGNNFNFSISLDDVATCITTGPSGNVYVVGYASNIVKHNNTPSPSHKDWWMKKFYSSTIWWSGWNGYEIVRGIRIDPNIWDMSNVDDISRQNSYSAGEIIDYGTVKLSASQHILSKYFQIPSPPPNQVSAYVIDMRIRFMYCAYLLGIPRKHMGGLVFLSRTNQSYTTSSYGVFINDTMKIINPTQYYSRANFNLTKYDSVMFPSFSVIKNLTISQMVYTPLWKTYFQNYPKGSYDTRMFQYYRIHTYLILNNTGNPLTNSDLITTYLYYDGCTGDDSGKIMAPLQEYISRLDNSSINDKAIGLAKLSGYIGIATGALAYNDGYVEVDWIRVMRLAPSLQPITTIGSAESINYGWVGTPLLKTNHTTTPNLFFPSPVNRDSIDVSNNVEFTISYLPHSEQAWPYGMVTRHYIITITYGNMTATTPSCNLEWTLNDCQGTLPPIHSVPPIELPTTQIGEYKKTKVFIEFPDDSEIMVANLTLKFTDLAPNQFKDITAITVDQYLTPSWRADIKLSKGILSRGWRTPFE